MGPKLLLTTATLTLAAACSAALQEGSSTPSAATGPSSAPAAIALACLTTSGWFVEAAVSATHIELHYNHESDGLQRKTTLRLKRQPRSDDASRDDRLVYGVQGPVTSSNNVGPHVGSGAERMTLADVLNDAAVGQLALEGETDDEGRVTAARIVATGTDGGLRAITGPALTCVDRPETFLELPIAP